MSKICEQCGKKNASSARFCVACGKSLKETERKAVSESATWAKLCNIFNTYVLKGIALLVCIVVFICGFFTSIRYMPQESIHKSIISGSTDDVLEAMWNMSFKQNVFNVIPAMTVGFDSEENQEQLDALEKEMTAQVEKITLKYSRRIAELSVKASNGDARASAKLVELVYEVAEEVCDSMPNINLIKVDRLEAELEYSKASETTGLKELKGATDSMDRTAVMIGYPVGYVYLQVVSLVYMILFTVSILKKNEKVKCGKFFVLYLSGFLFLFAIGQLTACSLSAAGMFCFIFTVVLGALYLAGKAVFTNRYGVKDILVQTCKGLTAVFSFVALCALLGNFVSLGASVGKVGSVFGKHVYDRYSFGAEAEIYEYTWMNFGVSGGLFLVMLALTALVFFRALRAFDRMDYIDSAAIPLSAVTAGINLASYIVLAVLGELGILDTTVESVVLVCVIFSVITMVFSILGHILSKNSLFRKPLDESGEDVQRVPYEQFVYGNESEKSEQE